MNAYVQLLYIQTWTSILTTAGLPVPCSAQAEAICPANPSPRHSRASGNPSKRIKASIPACAGMTNN
jgi:hypothetical protein